MKKFLLLVSLCWAASSVVTAQIVQQEPKLNASLTILMKKFRAAKATPATRATKRTLSVHAKDYAVTENIDVNIDCADAHALALQLQTEGYRATAITNRFVTAGIPLDLVDKLTVQREVNHIELSRQFKSKMNKARAVTKVDKIHAGDGLETPFTGKGVVLGVIDQGFQYKHPAFMTADGKQSRVIAGWIRRSLPKYGQLEQPSPWKFVPPVGEQDGSHATHVTAIAAGTEVGNGYGGVAPDAEIVMVPSGFNDSEIMEDVKFVKEIADKAGKPWVVNMSFGTQIGPHDGTTLYNQTIEQMIGPGALVTAANGNEGGMKLHASATLNPGEKRFIIFDREADEEPSLLFCLWAQTADSVRNLHVRPIVYADGQQITPSNDFWTALQAEFSTGVDRYNKKQFVEGYIGNFSELAAVFKKAHPDISANQVYVALKVESGSHEPQTFHLWCEPEHGYIASTPYFTGERSSMLRGNDQYLVGEGAASIPSAIAVASFNSSTSWVSLTDGLSRGFTSGSLGAVSTFSSPGPFLGDARKPLVAAPGSAIISAYNRFDKSTEFSTSPLMVDAYTFNKNKEYYGAMQGTSMATPMMSGILCLWLEAYPHLSYQDVEEIVKKTSIRDNSVGTAEWTAKRGYGKVDAYAGLKEVLKLAVVSGIDHVSNSATPITLMKEVDAWKILFNNAERFAHIRIFAADGRLVNSQSYHALSQGQEINLSLRELTPGAYLINIATAGSNTTRRVMVR